jgi:signal transduction histidine kinase
MSLAAGANPGGTGRLFPQLFEGLGPCLLATPSGEVVHVNMALRSLFQTHGEPVPVTLPAQLVRQLMQPEGQARSSALFRRGNAERQFRVQHRRLGAPGDADSLILSNYEEITTEVQALQTMRRTKERSEDLLGIVSDWVWEVDPDWTIRFVATRDDATLGQPAETLVGSNLLALGTFERNPDQPGRRPPQQRQRASFHDVLYRLRRPGERDRLFIAAGVPLFDDGDGGFRGFRGAAQDVTYRLAAEADARAYREQLEGTLGALAEKNQELETAVAEAHKASAAKTEFLAMMSHELRTPLNAVIGFSELMAAETFGPLGSDRYSEYMRDILNSARMLLGLINEILDFVKLDGGHMQMLMAPVDLPAVIRACARLVGEQASRKNLTLSMAVEPGLVVEADEKRLRQVMLNLLANAIKFTPDGGRIAVTARPRGDRVEITVADTGIGIAPQHLATVFQPFKQVDSALSRKYEGTGLGLPLAKLIVEQHGGQMTIESAPGQGTTLGFDLARLA